MPKEREEKTGLKMNAYTIIIVFALCCICGYYVELLWCYLRNGYFESRKSLVYGPFSVAYGMGGLLLTVLLYRLQKASVVKLFLLSMLAGTVVEYICSWGQETFFQSVAWDYRDMPLNINGRVCLLFSVFWGILGVGWGRLLYPVLNKLADRYGDICPKPVVWLFTAFFVFNCFVSATAGARMMERKQALPPSNAFEAYLDRHFPDERMRAIYANSKAVE